MRKRYPCIVVLVLAALLFSGCFSQDYALCPEETDGPNLVVLPDLKDAGGTSIFAREVNRMDVFLYDEAYRLLGHTSRTSGDPDGLSRFEYRVEPGTYFVLCWANAGAESVLQNLTTGTYLWDSYLQTVSPETASPLWYAPAKKIEDRPDRAGAWGEEMSLYRAVVREGLVTQKPMDMTRAYREISIYLKNYTNYIETAAPSLEFTNLPVQYDFFLRTYALRKPYRLNAVEGNTPEGTMPQGMIRVPISSIRSNAMIRVHKGSDGQTVLSSGLKTFMDQNATQIRDTNAFSVLVTYAPDGSATLSAPDW